MTAATTPARATARQPGAKALALTRRFPPRPVPESWPETAADRFAVVRRMLALMPLSENPQVCLLEFPTWLTLRVSG